MPYYIQVGANVIDISFVVTIAPQARHDLHYKQQ